MKCNISVYFYGSADGEDETSYQFLEKTAHVGRGELGVGRNPPPETGKARHDLTANSAMDRCHTVRILSIAIGDMGSEKANEITEPITHFICKHLCLYSTVENTVHYVWQFVLRDSLFSNLH